MFKTFCHKFVKIKLIQKNLVSFNKALFKQSNDTTICQDSTGIGYGSGQISKVISNMVVCLLTQFLAKYN